MCSLSGAEAGNETQADTLLSGKWSIFDYYMFVRAKFVEMSWQETRQGYVQVMLPAKIRRKK